MVDSELVDELDAASIRVGGITRMPPDAATAFIKRLAEIFVVDPSRLHWWESLKGSAFHLSYGDADGLTKLAEWVGEKADARLVVTDDEDPPWPVYSGDATKIIAMLRECRFCEYILAAHDMSWIIFDTHMNELVSVGLEVRFPAKLSNNGDQ